MTNMANSAAGISTVPDPELKNTVGGKGGIDIPSKPIADIVSSIICGGHDWVATGRQAEVPYFIFWTKTQVQLRCSKCGKVTWKDK